MCKAPKKSRQSHGGAGDVLKTAEAVSPTSSITTSVTSTTTTTLSSWGAEDRSAEKCEAVKPSEFLPKFAAVLNKGTGPVLNSVAALEAKRAHDSRTRLRSMLAVIAGEGMLCFVLSYALSLVFHSNIIMSFLNYGMFTCPLLIIWIFSASALFCECSALMLHIVQV